MIERFNTISEWVYFFLIVQVLWIIGVMLGGVILGIFPATYAMFAVVRKRIQDGDVSVNREFWKIYKSSFLKVQIQSWIWVLIGVFIYYDVRLLFSYQQVLTTIFAVIFVSVLIVYLLVSMLLIPIYNHYELTAFNRIRLASMIAIMLPYISIGLGVSTIGIYLLVTHLPVLFVFFGISLTAYLYTMMATFAFNKVEEKGFIVLESNA